MTTGAVGHRQQWLGLAGLLSASTVVVTLVLTASADSLPDPIATHWGIDGHPDGYMSLVGLLLFTAGLILGVGGLTGFLMARRTPSPDGAVVRTPAGESFGLAGFIAALGLALTLVTVGLNWGRASWQEAGALEWWMLIGTLIIAVAGGVLGYRIGRRWAPPLPIRADGNMSVPMSSASSWRGTARSPGQLFGAAIGVAVLLLVPGFLRWIGLLLVILGVLMSRLTVMVDRSGLRVRMGGFLPVRRYQLVTIGEARAEYVDPARWGGWGYRMIPDGSAVVIRAGEGIVLELRNGRRFAVTVDDAAEGAGVVNGLQARN